VSDEEYESRLESERQNLEAQQRLQVIQNQAKEKAKQKQINDLEEQIKKLKRG